MAKKKTFDTPHTVGIIGNPLDGTISPDIHNRLFKRMALPFVYLPFEVSSQHLPQLVRTMRLMDVEGLNVTAPHKMAVIPTLHRVDQQAKQIGAVNTIVMRGKKATGYNTDAPGFLAALKKQLRMHPRGQRVVILGAGGTARAIAHAVLRGQATHVTIMNRTSAKAKALQRHLRRQFRGCTIDVQPLTARSMQRMFPDVDLIIQTTSAPRRGQGALTWPARCTTTARLFDVRYGHGANVFLDAAKRRGLRVTDGFEMLIQQAALSFTLWTKQSPDLVYMRSQGRRALRNRG